MIGRPMRLGAQPSSGSILRHPGQASVARRRPRTLEKASIACAEPVAIILNRRRRHRGIAEVWVPFRVWTHITRYIPPRGFESIMEALAGDLAELRRWRRSGVHNNRPRMRASGHGKGQKQRSHRNPFLHVSILAFHLSPFLGRESCMPSKPEAVGFVAQKIGSFHRDQSS